MHAHRLANIAKWEGECFICGSHYPLHLRNIRRIKIFRNRFFSQGKKLKPEQEKDGDDEGDVTDEDEAADIDQEAASVAMAKENAGAEAGSSAGAEGPSTTSTSPPVKKKQKKPKKVPNYYFIIIIIYLSNRRKRTERTPSTRIERRLLKNNFS